MAIRMLPTISLASLRRRTLAAIAVLSVAIALFASSASTFSADEDEFTTTLHPGWNLVGWIHADAPASSLFEQIPELVLIRDNAGASATRNSADGQGSLRSLLRGEGYWFRIAANEPVQWGRSAGHLDSSVDVPAGGSIAAWTGGDNVPIGEALRDLGDNLRLAWRWDAASQEYRSWLPQVNAPYADDLGLRRGDAVLLNVNSATRWEQPTTDYPYFTFDAGVSHDVRRSAVADTRLVIDRMSREFGIDVDLDRLQFDVYIPADGDVEQPDSASLDSSGHRLRVPTSANLWRVAAAQAGFPIGRQELSYGYALAVVSLLAGEWIEQVPDWFRVAGPLWIQHSEPGGPFDLEWLMSYSEGATQYILADQPEHLLASTIDPNEPYAWTDPVDPTSYLGAATALWLVERHGARSLMDFWRHFAAQPDDAVDWRAAFQRTFGQSTEAFYGEFNQSVRERYPLVQGKIEAPAWIRLDRLDLTAHSVPFGTSIDIPISFRGAFRAALPAGVDMRFSLSLPRAFCSGFGTADGEIVVSRDVPTFNVDAIDTADVTLTIPDDFCATYIGGQVVDLSGEPVEGVTVGACAEEWSCSEVSTDKHGRFHILTTGESAYYLELSYPDENCSRFYRRGGTTSSEASRTSFRVGPASNLTVRILVPPSLCWSEITGVLSNLPETAPKMPLLGFASNTLQVSAIDTRDQTAFFGIITNDGRWTIAVPGDSFYRVRFEPRLVPSGTTGPGCGLEFPQGDIDSVFVGANMRARVTASLPDDFCR